MTRGGTDIALHDGKVGDPRRGYVRAGLHEHGDVEMVLEQEAGLDRRVVAAVDERNAFALEAHEGNLGRGLGGCGNERCHLRAGCRAVLRPARGLADVDVGNVAAGAFDRLREQRRLLHAADRERGIAGCGGAELVELGAAELVCLRDVRRAAAALHRLGIERHGVFARADQYVSRVLGHM